MKLSWVIKSETYKKGMLLSVIFNGIAKFILFILTIYIARLFGTNIKTDIYFFIYSVVLLFAAFINTIDTTVLIPESMRLREASGQDAAMSFLNYFIRLYFFIGIFFILIVILFGTKIFSSISRFAVSDINTYKNYFILGAFYFFFQVLINYINAILVSLKYFTVPMIISGINSLIIIAGSFLLQNKYDMLGVLISGLIAYTVNLIFLLYLLKKKAGWVFLIANKNITKNIWDKIFFAQIGQAATLASNYFPLFLLSGFGNGVISIMNYGKNIADIPNTLITAQVAAVSGIKLNEQAAANDYSSMNDTFIRSSKLLLFILVPLGCFMFVFAQAIVELFYKTKNFTPEAINSAAKFLQLLSVTIFSIGVNAMVSRIFIAAQKIKQAFAYQLLMNGLLITAIWILSKYYGAYGYPYGVIFINSINFAAMYFICKKFFAQLQYSYLLQYATAIILIHLLITVLLFYTLASADLFYFYKLLLGFCIYLLAVIVMSRIKKISV
jgi:peptidoglycan biosynthesis protein MviN/MurJ (putative lipid II flippase)